MRVLLIAPPGDQIGLDIGLGYVASATRQSGHELKILDINNYRVAHPELLIEKVISFFQPEVVGFSVMSLTFWTVKALVDSIRSYYSGWIVAGGAHVTIEQEHVLEEIEGIDFLVVREGEQTLPELLQALSNNGDLSEIDGLIFRRKGQIQKNQQRQFIKELDSLFWPDYRVAGVTNIERYPLLTSRGCPYSCIYCASPILCQKTWRPRQPRYLLDELIHAHETYHITSFTIMDDNFTLKIDRAIEFCDLLMKSKLGLPWECRNGIRADRVNEELAQKMKGAGCYRISLGVESLVPEIFDGIKKGESINDIVDAIKLFKKVGIGVDGFFLIGLPGDTYQSTLASFRLAKRIGFDASIWQFATPFPGTELLNWARDNANILMDYRDVNSVRDLPFDTIDYPKHEKEKAFLRVSIPNNQFPYDLNQSKISNLFLIIRLSIRYNFKHLHSNLWWLLRKGLSVLFHGVTRTSALIKMDPQFYNNFKRLD